MRDMVTVEQRRGNARAKIQLTRADAELYGYDVAPREGDDSAAPKRGKPRKARPRAKDDVSTVADNG